MVFVNNSDPSEKEREREGKRDREIERESWTTSQTYNYIIIQNYNAYIYDSANFFLN